MGYSYGGGYRTRIRFGGPLTPAVRALLIANGAAFALQVAVYLGSRQAYGGLIDWLALRPVAAIAGLRVWQFVTYSFLHEVAAALPLHILMNLFMLWMFGGDVEQALGRRRFLTLYFAAALAAGLCMIPWYHTVILGASGAVFGVMAMYGKLFPDRRVLIWGVFPVRARTLVLVLAALDLLFAVRGTETGTAHLAHVGGFVIGWFFLPLERAVMNARRERARRRTARSRQNEAEIRETVDRLLAKVGREGLNSLTGPEREFLKRAGKRLRR